MANFSYKRSTTTTMKLAGYLDTDRGIIDVDGVEKNIMTVLSDFNGADVTLTIKLSADEELKEPEESDEDSDE